MSIPPSPSVLSIAGSPTPPPHSPLAIGMKACVVNECRSNILTGQVQPCERPEGGVARKTAMAVWALADAG